MTIKTKQNQAFDLQFRHINRDSKRGGKLPRTRGFRALTICSITWNSFNGADNQDLRLNALGVALCVSEDQFNRRIGRQHALEDACAQSKYLQERKNLIVSAYHQFLLDHRKEKSGADATR